MINSNKEPEPEHQKVIIDARKYCLDDIIEFIHFKPYVTLRVSEEYLETICKRFSNYGARQLYYRTVKDLPLTDAKVVECSAYLTVIQGREAGIEEDKNIDLREIDHINATVLSRNANRHLGRLVESEQEQPPIMPGLRDKRAKSVQGKDPFIGYIIGEGDDSPGLQWGSEGDYSEVAERIKDEVQKRWWQLALSGSQREV